MHRDARGRTGARLTVDPATAPATRVPTAWILATLKKGAAATYVAHGAGFMANLLVVRWSLGLLGESRFGAWLTLSSAVAYLGVADLGLANALVNAAAAARAAGETARLRTVYATGVAVLSLLGAAATALFMPVAGWAPVARWFSLDPTFAPELRQALAVLVLLVAARLPGSAVLAVQSGIQELHRARLWQAVGSILQGGGAFLVVQLHGGMPGLAAAVAGGPLVAQLFAAADLRVRHTALRLDHAAVSLREARSLARPGMALFLQQVSALVILNTDNLVIAARLGAASVPAYAIPFQIASWTSMVVTAAASSAWPVLADLHARGDREGLRALFVSLLRAAVAIAVGAGVVVVVFAEDLARLWLGADTPLAWPVLWIMTIYALSYIEEMVSVLVLNATGRAAEAVRMALVAATLNLALSLALARPLGVVGVGLGTLVAAVMTTGWFLFVRACRAVEAPVPAVLRLVLRGWLPAAIVLAPAALLIKRSAGVSGVPAVGAALGLGGAYVIAVWFLALTPAERATILGRGAAGG